MAPVRTLLGEDADMAERGKAAQIVDAVMFHRPCFAERLPWKTPAAHAFLVGVAGEDGIGLGPFGRRQRRLPDRLTLRTLDHIGTILLELAAAARIQQR